MPQQTTSFPNFAPFERAFLLVGAGMVRMTALLNEIRMLDERLNRGELTPAEYATRRAAMLQSVETVETEFASDPAPRRIDRTANSSSAVTLSIVIALGVMALCAGLILLFMPDLNLALTLGVTVLAALSVALLRASDE